MIRLAMLLLLTSPAFAQQKNVANDLPLSNNPPTYMPYTTPPHGLDFDYFSQVMNERSAKVDQRFIDNEKYYESKFKALEALLTNNLEAERRGRVRADTDATAHVEARILELEKFINANLTSEKEARTIALATAKDAIDKSDKSVEIHFASVNEFRQSLSDQTTKFPSRLEVDVKFNAVNDKLASLEKLADQNAGKAEGINAVWVVLLGAIGMVIEVGTLVLLVVYKGRADNNIKLMGAKTE